MLESYCGKECNSCNEFTSNKCAGCRKGPGKAGDGDCLIASCCRTEGCEDCSKCAKQSSCIYFNLDAKKESDNKKLIDMANAIKIYFGFSIANIIVSFINNYFGDIFSILGLVITGSSLALSVIMIILQFKMEKYSTKFKYAAILTILNSILGVVFGFVFASGFGATIAVGIIFALGVAVVCNVLMGFSEMIFPYNSYLSVKFDKLVKVTFGFGIAIVLSSILSCVPFAGLVLLASIIGFVVCEIISLVHIYSAYSTCEYKRCIESKEN